MSNGIGNNLLHQSLLSPARVKHQSLSNSLTYTGGNAFFHPQANSLVHKCPISTEFLGNRLTVRKDKLKMGKHTTVSRSIRAVLAADPSSMVLKFKISFDFCSSFAIIVKRVIIVKFHVCISNRVN